jgi:hypothetical protein
MARRPAPPPKPKSPILTVGQKRRRIERLQKCVINLEAFDPHKARKRAPAVLELEAAIEIADAEPLVAAKRSAATPIIKAAQASTAAPQAGEDRLLQSRRWGGLAFEAASRRVARWWRGRD